MGERRGIAVAGTVLVDRIYGISAYPQSGELTKIQSITYALGGLVPNNGIGLKKINPDLPIYAVGKVGNDEAGRLVLRTLAEAGLNTDALSVCEGETTSFTDVMSVADGQRTFFTYPGASASFGKDDIAWERLPVKMLHLGYFLLLDRVDAGDGLEILKAAKERGIVTSIDLVSENSDRYALVLPCLPYVDNLILNEMEAGKLCGIEPTPDHLPQLGQRMLELGVRERVIIHMPEVGVCCSKQGDVTVRPSYRLPKGYIKGKTGAGDAFCSGALIAIERGATDAEILALAEAAAVASLSAPDATSGLREEKLLPRCAEDCKE